MDDLPEHLFIVSHKYPFGYWCWLHRAYCNQQTPTFMGPTQINESFTNGAWLGCLFLAAAFVVGLFIGTMT